MFWLDKCIWLPGVYSFKKANISGESVRLHDCFDLLDTFCLYSNYTKAIGSLSNNDGDGYENVTRKVNSR